jgi:hypothetical protein
MTFLEKCKLNFNKKLEENNMNRNILIAHGIQDECCGNCNREATMVIVVCDYRLLLCDKCRIALGAVSLGKDDDQCLKCKIGG